METFFRGKCVFLTGHTGFKGAWLCLWLSRLGARVTGYALAPPTDPSLFALARIDELVESHVADIRDAGRLAVAMRDARPDIVFHMAAQSLVRDSYRQPVETYASNVLGTVHLLDAVRGCPSVRAVVNVTSDKCYENRGGNTAYREDDTLGGFDPYSSSKACAELVTSAYRRSFFNPDEYHRHGVAIASVRAGNVIGGGDWARDRLIPDCVRSFLAREALELRHPGATRPWQYVLAPLAGYLMLARRLFEEGATWGGAWNFGPDVADEQTVEWIVQWMCSRLGKGAGYAVAPGVHPHEAAVLRLDSSKARLRLGWRPACGLEQALESICQWTQAYRGGLDLREVSLRQIAEYEEWEKCLGD